jgi:hypothetical protein
MTRPHECVYYQAVVRAWVAGEVKVGKGQGRRGGRGQEEASTFDGSQRQSEASTFYGQFTIRLHPAIAG